MRLTTNPGALVCDPMCGSGTTLPVAGKLRRRFAGGDVSEVAVRIVEARLRKSELPFESIVVDRG